MANAVRVAVVKGLHDLQECLTRLLLGVVAFVNDAVEEFSSGADPRFDDQQYSMTR